MTHQTDRNVQAALVRAAASFVRDTYSGEWADDAAATLETDAALIEQGEPCSLLRLAEAMQLAAVAAAVAPPTSTTHGLSLPHADALWDAVATPGPDRPTYPEQHERVCRAVREILDELAPAPAEPTPSHRAELRDEIAAAIWERQNPGRRWSDCEHPWGADAEADADAVLAVLYREWPWLRAEAEDAEPTDRAALRDRIAAAPVDRAAVLREVADELTRKANKLTERVHDLAYFVAKDRLREAEILDREATALRCMADETAAETPAPACAHCGQPISHVTGTLTAWWVHDPGGNTLCHPEHAARSHRATPQATSQPPAGARQDGTQPCAECGDPKTTHREGDDPVSPGHCTACPHDDAWHDYRPAHQNGTQS